MKLTPREQNHLLHVNKENFALIRGPAIAWHVANGIMPHEVLPMMYALVAELKEEQRSWETDQPWEPPAESGEIFKSRLKEFKQWWEVQNADSEVHDEKS